MDFRIANRDNALVRAARLEVLAEAGGTALDDPIGLIRRAARHREFASWVDAKIQAHPYQEA